MKKKLPTPQPLPSGQYRCQVMVNGKRESVVDADPDVAQAKAVALKNGLIEKEKRPESMTVGEAIDRYIESKDSVLSPSSIDSYKRKRKNVLQDIMGVNIRDLTQERVQRSINAMSKTHAPKSVRDAHGILSAALKLCAPDIVLRTTFPQKIRYIANIPSKNELEAILKISSGSNVELPVLLSAWLGLRTAEIRGIKWDCISGSILHVKYALVDTKEGDILKTTKTYSSDRKMQLPDYIVQIIGNAPHTSEYVVPLTRRQIYGRFQAVCKKAGVQHYRFYDLRHANASVMLALNVPDKYAMERMGHATTNMLKTVYQHTMDETRQSVDAVVDNYFDKILHADLHTEIKE